MTSDHIDKDLANLRNAATNGKWSEVLEMFKVKRELRTAKITMTGDTVLHMAVSSGKEDVVEDMVDFVRQERINDQDEKSPLLSVDENGDEQKLILEAKNEEGNTPLHLAASTGNIKICKKIGGTDPSLIDIRNIVGETPLFMAALYGTKKVFLWLYYLYMDSSRGSSTCDAHYKRDNGDTILHCAIAGGHIDLAIEIVLLYKDHLEEMTITRNKNGLSPLHLLAVTPSAFESTDLPGRSYVVRLLYHWFFRVNKKKQATTNEELEQREGRCLEDLALLVACYFIFNNCDDGGSSLVEKIRNLIVYSLCVLALLLLVPLFALERLYDLAGNWFHRIREIKEKHTWSIQIVEELLRHASTDISDISTKPYEEDNEAGSKIVETPLMIAAKNGVTEMVEQILELIPHTVKVVNDEEKNTVLLAVEKRQTKVYQILYENKRLDKSVFRQVDKDGNTALHLAAKLGLNLNWQTTTMVEEFKWFEFVKNSVPSELWEKYNNAGKTAEEIFIDSYEPQMTKDREWLNQTSEACSVVSTLVASMAFANVAINFDEKNCSSLLALSFSLTSTISFLAILAFRSQSLNFWRYVPFMLHLAILTMFGSIVSLWISLMLHDHSLTTYAILGLPIAILTFVSLPIFIGPTLTSMFTKVPAPSRKTTSAIRYRKPQKKEN